MSDFLSPAVDPYVRFVEACMEDFVCTSRAQNWSVFDSLIISLSYGRWLALAKARASAS